MIEKLIIAGFGGQGILTIGKLLGQCAIDQGLQVTYLPSYGSEVRGGTANCHVIISDAEIGSPVVEEADAMIIMNNASFDRFADQIRADGLLVLNGSLIEAAPETTRQQVLMVEATNMAANLGNVVVANMIMAGAYLAARRILPIDDFADALEKTLGERKAHLLPINKEALRLGAEEAARQGVRG